MALTPETITTKVDQLMELIKQHKEISFEDAASRLGVSVPVVEAWASFLEEEGLVNIKYNLTTPFLVYVPPAGEAKQASKPVEVKPAVGAKPSVRLVAPVAPEVLSVTDGLKRVSGLVKEAEGFLLKRDFDGAERRYYEARAVFGSLPVGFEKEKLALNSSMVKLFSSISSKKAGFLSRKFDYLSKEIEKAMPYFRRYVSDGRLEDAVNVYEQLKAVYNAVPDEFAEGKMQLHEQILSVYDELSAKLRARFLADMQDKSSRINALLDKMSSDTKSGQFELANQDYVQLNEIYSDLPRGFLMEKTALQNRIVRAYEELVSRSGKRVEQPSHETFDRVALLLRKADYYVRQRRFSSAIDYYKDALLLYRSLPASKGKSDMLGEFLRLKQCFADAVMPAESVHVSYDEDLSDVKVKISALKMVAMPAVKRVDAK